MFDFYAKMIIPRKYRLVLITYTTNTMLSVVIRMAFYYIMVYMSLIFIEIY